ncbi:MAG TPA: hypothetical protein VJC18_02405, partial [bacterium]|nr:hypothetical protein [bacterium]
WDDNARSVDEAKEHLQFSIDYAHERFPGKKFYVGEIGWPSQGRMRWKAEPSPVNEARYLRAVIPYLEKAGLHYNIIEAFDQPWKRNNEGCVGGYWGVYDEGRRDKNIFSGPLSNESKWLFLFFCSVLLSITLLTPVRWSAVQNSFVKSLLLFFLAALASFVLVAQGRAFYLSAFNLLAMSKAVFFLVFGLLGTLLMMRNVVHGQPRPSLRIPHQRDEAIQNKVSEQWPFHSVALRWAHGKFAQGTRNGFIIFEKLTVFLFITISLSLSFAGRSSSFLSLAFLFPVLFVLNRAWSQRHIPANTTTSMAEGILALILFVLILLNEGVINGQANLWMLLCVLTAMARWGVFSKTRLGELLRQTPWRTGVKYALGLA